MTIDNVLKNKAEPDFSAFSANLSSVATQGELFPLAALVEFPNAPTADAWGEVIAEDTQKYIVKADKGGPHVRAAEWIATAIAERLNISCATAKIIKMSDGQLLFGSRQISGKADDVVTAEILTSISLEPAGNPIPGLQSWLSGLYALDMFLNNVDRHENNFVSVDLFGTRRFSAIDFGRSLIIGGNFDAFPNQAENTVLVGRKIRLRHGFDQIASSAMLDRVVGLPSNFIAQRMAEMPDSWMGDFEKRQFLNWWSSPSLIGKVERLRKGLVDGSLL